MRKITKVTEPESLKQFKDDFPNLGYSDLGSEHANVRIDIRNTCLSEQFYLCAYCCDRITLSSSHNDHIIPQNSPQGIGQTLTFSNIVASCQSNKHCGHKKGNNSISISPLMDECETKIVFQLNGKMTHKSQEAQQTISTLNLQERGLVNKRKDVIDTVLFQYVDDLSNLAIEDSEYLELILSEICKPNDGKLEAFTPVIVNVLKQFLD